MEPCRSRSEEERKDFSDCFLVGEGRTSGGLSLPSCLNMCSLQNSNVLIEFGKNAKWTQAVKLGNWQCLCD